MGQNQQMPLVSFADNTVDNDPNGDNKEYFIFTVMIPGNSPNNTYHDWDFITGRIEAFKYLVANCTREDGDVMDVVASKIVVSTRLVSQAIPVIKFMIMVVEKMGPDYPGIDGFDPMELCPPDYDPFRKDE